MRRFYCLITLICLTACSTDDDFTPVTPGGPTIPTIGGTYSSSTMWRFDYAPSTGSEIFTCAGGITISTQVGNDFSGTFFISDAGCGNLGGTVTGGQLQTDGTVTFNLTVEATDPNFLTWAFGCTYVSGDRGMTGTLTGNQLRTQARLVMDCPQDGRVNLFVQLDGTR
jgi:hypothetical protein